MARGYSRGRAKDDAARAALKPLAEGERPLAVTIAGVVALVFGLANLVPYLAGLEIQGERPALIGVLLFTGLMLVAAWGCFNNRYWAVLGMEALLGLIVVIFSLLVLRSGGIVELLSTPEQKEILDRVTGMMSLLEGHADVVMDGVGPSVIPSVDAIRASFTQRRKGVGTLDRLLRRLLGLDAKMAQYRDGAHFVRSVVDKVGMAEFNAVWERAEHLPSKAELADPDAWVGRVLG